MRDYRRLTTIPVDEIREIADNVAKQREWNRLRKLSKRLNNPEMLPHRQCPTCLNDFRPTRYWQRFCNAACRNEFARRELEIEAEMRDAEIKALQEENKKLRERIKELEA